MKTIIHLLSLQKEGVSQLDVNDKKTRRYFKGEFQLENNKTDNGEQVLLMHKIYAKRNKSEVIGLEKVVCTEDIFDILFTIHSVEGKHEKKLSGLVNDIQFQKLYGITKHDMTIFLATCPVCKKNMKYSMTSNSSIFIMNQEEPMIIPSITG